jgi:hypothetical protein
MATKKVTAPKAAKKVAEPVQFITVSIPLKGKPFTSFKSVIEAYHKLTGFADDFLEGSKPIRNLDLDDKLQALFFLTRLATWDGKTAIQSMIDQLVASLGVPEA